MRTQLDLNRLAQTAIGFEPLIDVMERILAAESASYPPCTIEKHGEDRYRICLAVAGFAPDEITVTAQPNLLVVSGCPARAEAREVLHGGLGPHPFERRFQVADHMEVMEARLDNGLLAIDLVRNLPEELKPRRIPLAARSGAAALEDRRADVETRAAA